MRRRRLLAYIGLTIGGGKLIVEIDTPGRRVTRQDGVYDAGCGPPREPSTGRSSYHLDRHFPSAVHAIDWAASSLDASATVVKGVTDVRWAGEREHIDERYGVSDWILLVLDDGRTVALVPRNDGTRVIEYAPSSCDPSEV